MKSTIYRVTDNTGQENNKNYLRANLKICKAFKLTLIYQFISFFLKFHGTVLRVLSCVLLLAGIKVIKEQ